MCVCGHLSSLTSVNLGVPQGSILGPLMFIIFMNDLILEIENSKFEMYADDSTLCNHAKHIQEINQSLSDSSKAVYAWIEENRMVLNIPKTESLLIGTSQRVKNAIDDFQVGEGEYQIKKVDSHKLLGTYIDNTLSWSTHIDHTCNKVRSRLYVFNRTKYLLPHKSRVDYYNGLIQPIIDYGCVVWGNCSRQLMLKVHRVMKSCARSILDIYNYTEVPSIELFRELDWLPIDARVNYFEALQVFNIINGNCPDYMKDFIKPVTRSINTRSANSQLLEVPRTKLKTGQRSFGYRAAVLWNSLNCDVKQATNVDTFKSRCRKYLMEKSYAKEKFSLDQPKYYNE